MRVFDFMYVCVCVCDELFTKIFEKHRVLINRRSMGEGQSTSDIVSQSLLSLHPWWCFSPLSTSSQFELLNVYLYFRNCPFCLLVLVNTVFVVVVIVVASFATHHSQPTIHTTTTSAITPTNRHARTTTTNTTFAAFVALCQRSTRVHQHICILRHNWWT